MSRNVLYTYHLKREKIHGLNEFQRHENYDDIYDDVFDELYDEIYKDVIEDVEGRIPDEIQDDVYLVQYLLNEGKEFDMCRTVSTGFNFISGSNSISS